MPWHLDPETRGPVRIGEHACEETFDAPPAALGALTEFLAGRADHRRRDIERHFAAIVAEEAAAVWGRYPSCELVVVAPPVMLGLLRPAIDRQLRAKDQITIKEVLGDHTKLNTPKLHDLLAESELLPERGRRAPVLPTPGLPA